MQQKGQRNLPISREIFSISVRVDKLFAAAGHIYTIQSWVTLVLKIVPDMLRTARGQWGILGLD